MDLKGRKSNLYFDKAGKQILEGDLLKVYHYGSANRTRYMYHIAVIENTKDFPVMAGRSLYSEKPHYRFYVVCDNEYRMYKTAKIIYEKDWQTKRLRVKLKKATEI